MENEQSSSPSDDGEPHPSPGDNAEEVAGPSRPKRVKVAWQETLLALIAGQQEQLKELTRCSKMATVPTPSPSPINGACAQASNSTSSNTSFRLSEFNPDMSNYAIEEWLEDATKLKEELSVSDMVMIMKAGEVLKGRAHRYYCDWRPVRRTWDNFCKDLVIAFPDRETPGVRAFNAATLRSRDCDSLSDYGIQKLRYIRRFCDSLPWATILSMIEYGLENPEVQATIRVQKPSDERQLLKLLSEFDARRHYKSRELFSARAGDAKRGSITTPNRQRNSASSTFSGVCFQCGQHGHSRKMCRFKNRNTTDVEMKPVTNLPTCTHCKKIGHKEDNCWFKHGRPKPKKILLIRKCALARSPIATLLFGDKAMSFSYIIDSGAETSIISQNTAIKLDGVIKPVKRLLTGLGNTTVYSLGMCEVIAVLPTVTLEILFTVVPNDVMPADLDVIIGWDVISRPDIQIGKDADGIQLNNNPRNVLIVKENDFADINVSGLDQHTAQKL